MTYRRTCAFIAPLLAVLAFAGTAHAWHASATVQCPPGSTTVTATYSYVFPSGGPWTATQQILEVNPRTDQWTVVASQNATGYGNNLTPNVLTVQQPLDGKPHTYVAKTFWDNGDEGHAKSPMTVCAPLTPVPGCDGKMYPPGQPLPVCAPPPAPPAPPVAPPVPPETPVTPPDTPRPCVGPYRVTKARVDGAVRFRLRDQYGILHKARWSIDGRYQRTTRVFTVPRRELRGRHVVAARSKRHGCRGSVRVSVRRPTVPRFAG